MFRGSLRRYPERCIAGSARYRTWGLEGDPLNQVVVVAIADSKPGASTRSNNHQNVESGEPSRRPAATPYRGHAPRSIGRRSRRSRPGASRHRRARPLPVLAAHSHAESHSRQAQTGAGSRALAAAEGVCAAARDGSQKAAPVLTTIIDHRKARKREITVSQTVARTAVLTAISPMLCRPR
jgi:hypothetical protein